MLAVWAVQWAARAEASACLKVGDRGLSAIADCVRTSLETAEHNQGLRAAVMEQKAPLEELSAAQGYEADRETIKSLQDRSRVLKSDPLVNREAISLLDFAIAAHADEIGPKVSTTALARGAKAGEDIAGDFLKQKLAFLTSERARFYDRGPFEIGWRSLLVSTLEALYFREEAEGRVGAPARLEQALRVLDEILDRRTDPKFSYLGDRSRASLNSDLFWRASLLYASGKVDESKRRLAELAERNADFDFMSADIGHVHVYKVFLLPQPLRVEREIDRDGRLNADGRDPLLVERFYNPAQLALFVCSQIGKADKADLASFTNAVNEMSPADFYVVLASSANSEKLRDLKSRLDLRLPALGQQLHGQVGDLGRGFASAMKSGSETCGVGETVRRKVYEEFEPSARILADEKQPAKPVSYVVVGGRLSARQADLVAKAVDQGILRQDDFKAFQEDQELKVGAFSARMRIGD